MISKSVRGPRYVEMSYDSLYNSSFIKVLLGKISYPVLLPLHAILQLNPVRICVVIYLH